MSASSSATSGPPSASASAPSPREQRPTDQDAVRESGSGLNVWGWLALLLFVTSALAMTAMLILKWSTGGGEVWPWFTRYTFFAFPAAFVFLILSLLHTWVQRRRN